MRWWLWLACLLVAACGHQVDGTAACSRPCPKCEEPDCENTILDQCNCCPVCLREVGEPCGGSLGVCVANLTCAQEDDEEAGKCIVPAMRSENCLKAKCDVVFHPNCPSDSRLVISPPPLGECCGTPGTCQCDEQKCEPVPICKDGMERFLIVSGKNKPGSCCHKYECREKESHCIGVRCPRIPLDEDEGAECPPDSFRPAEHVPKGACCPVRMGCRCKPSICQPVQCPEGKEAKVNRKGNGSPGRCCDEWQCEENTKSFAKSCERDGRIYSDGRKWVTSSCESCQCKKGVAVCSKMQCPKTPPDCTWVMIPEGECCPVCMGCQTDKQEKKKKYDQWQKDDCTTCTCSEEGTAVCEKFLCSTNCENPVRMDGQCCPVCDEPTVLALPPTCPQIDHCPLRCENGLQRDDRGCFECKCLPATHPVDCPTLNKDNCDKKCAHGYLRDNKGCGVCKCAKCPPLHQCFKHCLYGYESNSAGCPVCKCRAMTRIDARLTVTDEKALKNGWDKCVSSNSKGKLIERDSGEWWNDGCRHCFCEEKQEFCSVISCPPKPDDCPEDNWIMKEGDCCHSCTTAAVSLNFNHRHTVCQSPGSGRLFTDGETWQLAPCISCTCRVGQVLCHSTECQPTACRDPKFYPDDQCCSRCSMAANISSTTNPSVICTDDTGAVRIAGASWRTDDCTSCNCGSDGKVVCYQESCDDSAPCKGHPLIVKGRCCPVCSDALSTSQICSYKSAVYSINEEWKDGPCTKCICAASGQTICKETLCPACSDPVPIEGHCCPLCKDSGPHSLDIGVSGHQPIPPSEPSYLPMLGFLLTAFAVIGLLVILLILYRRSRFNSKPVLIRDASVRLSATKHIGSTPQLADDWLTRRDSHCDGQSESLLSTVSDTSTAVSSASSGTDPQPDTRPLTGEARGKFQCHV